MLDDRDLLRKYMQLVAECDGVTFVDRLRTPGQKGYAPERWTEAEIRELEKVERDAELAYQEGRLDG